MERVDSLFGYSGTTQAHVYSTRRLFNYGYVLPGGSVLNWQLAARTIAMCGAATFFALYPCSSSKTLGWQFCFPVLQSGEGLIFAGLVSFLLGLFQSTTFSRWWSTREKLGIVMNNVKSCSVMLMRCVNGADAAAAHMRDNVIRWLNLSHALVYKHANNDYNLRDLQQDGLATEEECELLLSSPNMPGAAFDWAVAGFRDLTIKNHFTPAGGFTTCLGSMNLVFTAGQEVAMFIETQLPYSYIHLLTFITKVHLVFVVFYGAGIILSGISAEAWTRIIFGYATIATNNVIYEGLLYIHDILVNPLGTDFGDFPTGDYIRSTENFSKFVQKNPAPPVSASGAGPSSPAILH